MTVVFRTEKFVKSVWNLKKKTLRRPSQGCLVSYDVLSEFSQGLLASYNVYQSRLWCENTTVIHGRNHVWMFWRPTRCSSTTWLCTTKEMQSKNTKENTTHDLRAFKNQKTKETHQHKPKVTHQSKSFGVSGGLPSIPRGLSLGLIRKTPVKAESFPFRFERARGTTW